MDKIISNSAKKQMSAPVVRRYLDVTLYLQDYFRYRKAQDPKFSYEEWAIELGFKSRTFIRLLCQGKRTLTDDFLEIFSTKMNLSSEDQEHLTLLALYARAGDATYKNIYLSKIFSSRLLDETSIEASKYAEFLASPDLPLLQLLLAVDGLKASKEVLAILLETSAEQILLKLQVLKKLGLAEVEGEVWKSKFRSFKVSEQDAGQALALYHKETLKEAESYISRTDLANKFRSVMFSFHEQNFLEIDKEIEDFLLYIKNKYNSPKSSGERFFKLNLQLYPVTEPLSLEEK